LAFECPLVASIAAGHSPPTSCRDSISQNGGSEPDKQGGFVPKRPSHKLVVILHADVVGSTVLVQHDETVAHQRIQDCFRRFSETIDAYCGVTHEIRGDALVAEFDRASDAVCAGIAFQADNSQVNATLEDDVRPEVRIGISMGEVVIADNTITGAGVILAQRLEQLANPGGMCIQDAAYQSVPKRLPFEYQSKGEQTLKGFEEPVRAYTVTLKAGEVVPATESLDRPARATLELPNKPSIAVLPFTNMSGDSEQEYFSDGITEDIITALSRISGLLVIARNSVMGYKGKTVDTKRVGREQGVRYVLEGSVRKSANRIRVTAQLIDASTGHHQWADRYDRNVDDIFTVQDDITRAITVELRVQLMEGEQARMLAGRTDNIEAWDRVIRANEFFDQFIREDNLEARRLAEEALRIDPQYVGAWETLGWTHVTDAAYGWSESREQSTELASKAALAALRLEEDYPDALAVLAMVHWLRGEFDRSVETAERAARLAPSNAANTFVLGVTLTFAGKAEEALGPLTRAIRLCPNSPANFLRYLGVCYHLMNENELAISTLKKAVAISPDSMANKIWLVSALVEEGFVDDAEQVAEEVMRTEPKFSAADGIQTRFKDATLNERILRNLLTAGLSE
jgi:adenylate cyclase